MGTVTKPYDFNPHAANAKIESAQVDSDFDTLYTLVNGNIEDANIKAGGIGTVSIADNAIATAKIPDAAITPAKIATADAARVYNSADQSVGATWTVLAFNSETFDTNALHDNAVNNSRLTCKTAGTYIITGTVMFASSSTGYRGISLLVNGTTDIAEIQQPPAAGTGTALPITAIYHLVVGDYVELRAVQTTGGALNALATQTSFAVARIG